MIKDDIRPKDRTSGATYQTKLDRLISYSDFCFVPIAMLAIAIVAAPTGFHALMGMSCGLIVWTFAEYWMHRAFHSHRFPGVRKLHMQHHQHPKNASGGTLHSLTITAVLSTVALVWVQIAPLILGFLGGYLCFMALHNLLHHWVDPRSPFVGGLARNHEIHHHEGIGRRYGVLTSFWDNVFRTA